MASVTYNSAYKNAFLGRIIVGTSTFKVLLTGSGYVENPDTHEHRGDITNEVTGTGYTAGGQIIVPTLTQDLTTEKTILTFPSITWASSTISGVRKALYYVSNGGAASSDWLIGCNDFGADYSSSASSLIIAASTLTITRAA